MRFEGTEYTINNDESITISKKALEEWRSHYIGVSNKTKDESYLSEWHYGFYMGKADTLTEILKHFDNEE